MASKPKDTVGLHAPLAQSEALRESVKSYVEEYMSRFDASHDFKHILRVYGLAKSILSETQTQGQNDLDETATHLAALVHDVGDHKYARPDEDPDKQIMNILLERGASPALAAKVHTIAKNVSYTNEVKDPATVQAVLAEHPELGVVQDADRIDAIGAIGIGRCFTYGAAKAPERGMQGSVDHFAVKLERLESMMKTEAGRRLAKERTERLRAFRSWWEEESSFADA